MFIWTLKYVLFIYKLRDHSEFILLFPTDQFLKNASHRLAPSESGDSAGAGDEADVEDNQPPSVTSSKSNVSDNSGVSKIPLYAYIFYWILLMFLI